MRFQRHVVGKIWALLTPSERRSLIALLGFMLIGMVLQTLGVGLIIPVIALLTQDDYTQRFTAIQPLLDRLGNPGHRTLVVAVMLGLAGIFLIKTVFLVFVSWWENIFTFGVQASLSQRLFAVYLGQPYTFHLERNSAQLIRNAFNEVNLFVSRALTPTLHLVGEGLIVVGLCALLLVVEPVGALLVMTVLGAAAWIFHGTTRSRTEHWARERQHHEGLRIQHLQQGLASAKDVKLMGREATLISEYRVHSLQSARASRFHAILQQVTGLWLELLAVVGIVGVVLVMIARGRTLESVVPTIGLFGAVAFRLMPSANRILLAVQSLRYGWPTIETLYQEMQLAVPGALERYPSTQPCFDRDICLDNVTFTYAGAANAALRDVSFRIARGECIGFVGASGSGKSTLVNVILGLLRPTAGRVLVDGVDIQAALRGWQDQIGYVPQSIYLTDDTLRRNVAFGLAFDRIDDNAVKRAIKAAQLESFIEELPSGLETIVGERGVRLSGGQAQRIGIARALYHNPSVLILDEATSALDSVTEAGVMEAVTALHGTKTILVVAHRLSTVEHCDRVYRMHLGGVEEKAVTARPVESKGSHQ